MPTSFRSFFLLRRNSISNVYLDFSDLGCLFVRLADASRVSGLPISLPSQYSVTSPAAVHDALVRHNATTSLYKLVALRGCTPDPNVVANLIQATNATALPEPSSPSANPTSSSSAPLSFSSISRSTAASSLRGRVKHRYLFMHDSR